MVRTQEAVRKERRCHASLIARRAVYMRALEKRKEPTRTKKEEKKGTEKFREAAAVISAQS